MEIEMTYNIYETRSSLNLSSGKLSKLSGVGKATINDIENYRHDPTIKTICMLAEAMKVSPERLYSYTIK